MIRKQGYCLTDVPSKTKCQELAKLINENNPKVDTIANKKLPSGCIRSDEQIHGYRYFLEDGPSYPPENRIYVSWNEAKSEATCGFISNGCQD